MIASSTVLGAFEGGQLDFECSCFRYCSSSFFSPNFTKQRRTARFSLSKSTGIDFLSGFIDTPNPRFSPRVSNTSFDTDSLFSPKLWHFKLLGFHGRSFGSVVVSIRCSTFRLTVWLASTIIPFFLWQMLYSFCRVVSLLLFSLTIFLFSLLLLCDFLFVFILSPFLRVFRLVSTCPWDFFFGVFHLDSSLNRMYLHSVALFFCCCCCIDCCCIGCYYCVGCCCCCCW